ncbi:MAG: NAD(P)H-quinone oxidoreductase subunit 1, chloroplastic [Gemmatimonadaceae bacterium]|nr:NAD(P)H-quinone oxidoreductase subunit 1, chloroplastic [Gemmatimonadaceae bacterium]
MSPSLSLALLQVVDRQAPAEFWPWFVATLVKLVALFTIYMIVVAYTTLAERKVSAWMQDRYGPNRVGPRGLFQPLADGLKNIMKEETLPPYANKVLFMLAPAMAFIPAMILWAVIPFAAPWASPWGRIEMQLAPLPIGLLFVIAFSSLGVYGIVLAGWSSNNKYALLGGLRSSAQMVSYEISMGMSLIPVLLVAGNVTLNEIVNQQASLHLWNVLTLGVGFFLYTVSAFAETNRLPFDLPEAESELITGYHTEYSAMKFSLFFIAEYANMLTQSAMIATLFFGGWDIPFMRADNVGAVSFPLVLLSFAIMFAKTLFFLFFFIWIRWTLPRFRYDQLMSIGWKVLLPIALAYIVIVAGTLLALDAAGLKRDFVYGAILFAVNAVLAVVMFRILDRGRIVSPAYGRLDPQELARLRSVSRARTHLTVSAGD